MNTWQSGQVAIVGIEPSLQGPQAAFQGTPMASYKIQWNIRIHLEQDLLLCQNICLNDWNDQLLQPLIGQKGGS